jgi:hypothetical protein
LLDVGDAAHAWTVDQFRQISGPLLTCEPVLAEALTHGREPIPLIIP